MSRPRMIINPKTQVFTPESIIETMLSYVPPEKIIGRRFLENSFGDGRIIARIAELYIQAGFKQALKADEIAEMLSHNIVGIEIDADLCKKCRCLLNGLANSYGIQNISWDLRNRDALSTASNELFDYVIGNPPYLEYKEIEPFKREELRENFESCAKGKFDYCYAFIESGIKHLTDTGLMIQLVPGSVFKNTSAKTLRDSLRPGLAVVVDYSGIKVFNDALVSPCIFVYKKSSNQSFFDVVRPFANECSKIDKALLGSKWSFSPQQVPQGERRFGDTYHASMSVATLFNEAFLIDKNQAESRVVRKAASPKKLAKNEKEYIIFPYKVTSSKVVHYEESFFREHFPRAAAILETYREQLNTRSVDSNSLWFEYGRNQGIAHIEQDRLLISTIVSGRVKVFRLSKGTVPYGGIVISSNSQDTDLEEAKRILEADDFVQYAYSIGTSVSGNSVRITCRDVNDYLY